MKILALTRYDRLGGSSRLRSMQYIPHYQAAGIEVDCDALLDKEYITALYDKRPINKLRIIKAYLRRVWLLLRAKKYDLLWIEKELFPWLPAIAERILHRCKIPYIVDFDDAVFHYYDQHRSPYIRKLLGKKIDQVMKRAAVVIAGNEYLADRAKLAGAREIAVIPTVIDIERYAVTADEQALTIGWIGSPGTFHLLQLLSGVFAQVLQKYNAKLLIVGAKGEGFAGLPVEWVDWQEETEVALIQRMSIGVMPLEDKPFNWGKCGYKLIQYMACAKPIVASPIGVNSQIVNHGVNGFLANNDGEWIAALEQLLSDAQLRRTLGQMGRLSVEQKYCLQVTAPQTIELLKKHAKN